MRSALLLLALFASGSVGCVNNDASLSILQMQDVSEATSCTATSAVGVGLSRGIFDVHFSNGFQGYLGFPIVRNNETSRMPSSDSPQLNSIQLLGANVSLSFTDATAESKVPVADRKFFWASAGGRLDPSDTGPLPIEVVPIDVITALKLGTNDLVTVTAKIEPVGMQTSDRLVGGPIYFPVDICNGCLGQDLGACPLPAGTVATATCFPAQDVSATCCESSTELLCGTSAPVAGAASIVQSSGQ